MDAPNRGKRKCATCIHYTEMTHEWDKDCKLDICRCLTQDKVFGRGLCPNYMMSKRSLAAGWQDTSRGIGGTPTGLCEWKCPPIMRNILYSEWKYRMVNANTSWCHCWEEKTEHHMDVERIRVLPMLEQTEE